MKYNPNIYELIYENVYDIPKRLKEIDSGYYVLWNKMLKRFEIHSTKNKMNSYCFHVPYKELDARTIELAKKTRIYNMKKLIREMDSKNIKKREYARKKALDEIGEATKDIYRYSKRSSALEARL